MSDKIPTKGYKVKVAHEHKRKLVKVGDTIDLTEGQAKLAKARGLID